MKPQPSVSSLRSGLPGWAYVDPEFHRLERERIFRHSWQVVCHESELAKPGDYYTFDFLDEAIVVVRGEDRRIRAFFNVCRHRAARLLDGTIDSPMGHCARRITCPYHAWSYDLTGRLVGVPQETAYPGLDKDDWGLREAAVDQWQGFVFVSLAPTAPTIAEMMEPHVDGLVRHRLPDLRMLGRTTLRYREVNWKTIVDNYIDGLHINVAHAGLRRLAGRSYRLVPGEYVQHMCADLIPEANASWAERAYCELLERSPELPEPRTRWSYFLLWPNLALDIYPDQIDFMQMIPLGPKRTLIREIAYGLPEAPRELRVLRYLNWRINRQVNAEDTHLITGVQAGMGSRSFVRGPLSESEVCLERFAARMRQVMPECRGDGPPDSRRVSVADD